MINIFWSGAFLTDSRTDSEAALGTAQILVHYCTVQQRCFPYFHTFFSFQPFQKSSWWKTDKLG